LKARQQSDAFTARRKEFQRDILDSAEHPRDDFTLFIVLLIDRRPVTISVPESSAQSLFVFSTRVHAHDYVRTLLTSAPRVQHDGATPSQLVGLLRTLKQVGIDSFTVDHCPRCRVLSTILSDSITEVS